MALEIRLMKLFEEISNPREIRRKLGLNQHDFWSKVGGNPERRLPLRKRAQHAATGQGAGAPGT